MLSSKGNLKLVLSVVLLGQSIAWAADDNAGRVLYANGNVKIVSSGSEQLARKGSFIKEGDTIITGNGLAQVNMKDRGVITVRPDSQLQIVTYQMDANGNGGRAIFSLVKGAFRSLTGLIGKKSPGNYAVETPTATIGVRGTDHEPQVIPPGGWPGAPRRSAGTYDTVYSGSTFMTTKGGKLEISPGQTGYAPSQSEVPILQLSSQLNSMRSGSDKNLNQGSQKMRTTNDEAAQRQQTQLPYQEVINKYGLKGQVGVEDLENAVRYSSLRVGDIVDIKKGTDGTVTITDKNGRNIISGPCGLKPCTPGGLGGGTTPLP